MWLMTTRGFFSVVQHFDDAEKVLIRARAREDLESLCELAEMTLVDASASGLSADAIIEMEDADYRYRLIADGEAWAEVVSALNGRGHLPQLQDRGHSARS